MIQKSFRHRLTGMFGNLLEHYDSALFGLLAPFIAPLFFAEKDPISALILTYAIIPLGFITKPLGSVFFGWIGDRLGRRHALCGSLFGMAIVTIGTGFLPVFKDVGAWAPVFLGLARMLQSFFAAGESAGGAIFVLEHTTHSKRSFLSGFYDSTSVGGVLLASLCITILSATGNITEGWRALFWAGGLTALCGIFLRLKATEGPEFVQPKKVDSGFRALKENKQAFFSIVLVSGFSYTTYSLAFTLMNGYVPLVTHFTKTDVMQVNSVLLVFDLLLLPFFGYLADKIGKEKVMLAGSLSAVILAIPLFSILNHASLFTVIAVRFSIVVCGVAFAAPYYAWAIEKVPSQHRYLFLSLGAAFGSQLIGHPTSFVCLWLYKTLGWCGAPALYLLIVGGAAAFIVRKKPVSARQLS
ncbi:MAG TPA: MFS transporter [Chlamydiales bacterium]|nr:MFS transporter [Chlamydiales bacterium]